jgi:hypothetical protein
VDGAAGEGVQEHRQGRGQRLPFAGLHLGDRAGVKHHSADQLDVEMALTDGAPAGLADDREARAAGPRSTRRWARFAQASAAAEPASSSSPFRLELLMA